MAQQRGGSLPAVAVDGIILLNQWCHLEEPALLLLPQPSSKSMQEGWGSGGDEMNLGTSQWEDEDGDMWNNAASQESSSSCSSWGNASKKGLQKGIKTPGKQDEAWIMSRLIKQLTDMGFPVTGILMSCPLS
ncbi:hypothetical protein A6R68_12066 [Neotoma lepida]|uniref:Argonaute hook domain-containing protein n=1 Tax=Neotoma lepida TaxID=56216 RepID=A0A1A6H4Z9_NEOLE|nr:hypothetical protein A6R68_12066 [Neotoma lepida]